MILNLSQSEERRMRNLCSLFLILHGFHQRLANLFPPFVIPLGKFFMAGGRMEKPKDI